MALETKAASGLGTYRVNYDEIHEFRGMVNAELRALNTRLDRFETTCVGCQTNVNGQVGKLHVRINELSRELIELRVRVAWFAGAAAIAGAIAGQLVGVLIAGLVGG